MAYKMVVVTKMNPDTREDFISLVERALQKCEAYKEGVATFMDLSGDENEPPNGVLIDFYALDSDTYKDNVDAVSWRIEFSLSKENKVVIRGYEYTDVYELIELETKKSIFKGTYEEVEEHINSDKYTHLSQPEFSGIYTTLEKQVDMYKVYLEDVILNTKGVTFEFKPYN